MEVKPENINYTMIYQLIFLLFNASEKIKGPATFYTQSSSEEKRCSIKKMTSGAVYKF